MAENKKSFVLYCDQDHIFNELTDQEAGILIKKIFDYVNDRNPEIEDRLLKISFEHIKRQLKRDLKDWQSERERRSNAGKKGMQKRWGKITDDNSVISTITEITDNATVNVNVTAISREKVVEFLRGAAPISISQAQVEEQADLLMKQYQGKKIGNLRALCNKWMHNFQDTPTMPKIEPNYWDKLKAAL